MTSMADDPVKNNAFFTNVLGLRRVKKTVNFDRPDVYHLYYGDEVGTPGSVMTYFPFPGMARGQKGVGEVGLTAFSVPAGALKYWSDRLNKTNVGALTETQRFGQNRLEFIGPDGDEFALVEVSDDERKPWLGSNVRDDVAIRGFHSTSMRLHDGSAMKELLTFMNYSEIDRQGDFVRLAVENGNGADVLDLELMPSATQSNQGAGSVHHLAFCVEDRDAQLRVREALSDTGYAVTPVIDRDYFWAIYFKTPGGILFEVATNEPGFERDEDRNSLGESLRLPDQHEHLREMLEDHLQPIS